MNRLSAPAPGLAQGFTWTHKKIRLVGYSMAGISTSFVFPDADVCFDVAQGLPFQVPINNILISHGHLDHAAGIPYLIGQKAMTGQLPPKFFMPAAIVSPFRQMMRIWEEIESHSYHYEFRAVQPGDTIPLKEPFYARVFKTYHRVPSQGYTVLEKKKRLKPEYRDLEPHELGKLRKSGVDPDEHYEDAILSFSGDTRIEFLDDPMVRASRVLIMEVTYWDQRKTIANAREWGHIHFDELLQRLPEIKSEKILLIHASARYTTRDLLRIIDERVPEQHKGRIEVFTRPS